MKLGIKALHVRKPIQKPIRRMLLLFQQGEATLHQLYLLGLRLHGTESHQSFNHGPKCKAGGKAHNGHQHREAAESNGHYSSDPSVINHSFSPIEDFVRAALPNRTKGCDIRSKVEELRANPNAQVVAQHENDSWLSLSGQVEILNDRARVEELWQEPYRAWFPNGKDDPDLRVLAFRAERGEYWDQRGSNKVEYALKVAKAYATGEQPDPGTHSSVRL